MNNLTKVAITENSNMLMTIHILIPRAELEAMLEKTKEDGNVIIERDVFDNRSGIERIRIETCNDKAWQQTSYYNTVKDTDSEQLLFLTLL